LPDKFFFFAGRIDSIKNIASIINAFSMVKRKLNTDYKLILAGEDKNEYADKMKTLVKELKLEDDIKFLGFILDDLPCIYNLAEVFIFPSHIENFGLALVEAMSCGLPVISSDITDIREVAGDACLLVNPDNIDDIADAIEKVILSDELRLSMRNKSLERAKLYSWEDCARRTLDVYNEVM
jgi:glycosyltransferase involved in cell wall biosynthesis